MIVRVDAATPGGIEAFRPLGDVRPFTLDEVRSNPGVLSDAQVLIVRSAQRVDARLLETVPALLALATPVVGIDHVDAAALDAFRRARGRPVPLFHAPGSTAGAVGDFALAAILAWAAGCGRAPESLRVGIVGLGRCGTALARRLERFGASWVAHDPPRAAREPGFRSATLDEVLACDAVSLHVPLTGPAESAWPTRDLVDAAWLARAPRGARLLVNTARGGVVDGGALREALAGTDGWQAALDVWQAEPAPDPALVAACRLATPHAAGSVFEGRFRAAVMVTRALRRFLEDGTVNPPEVPDDVPPQGPAMPAGRLGPAEATIVREAAGVEALSADFRSLYAGASPGTRAAVFDQVRRSAMRREVAW